MAIALQQRREGDEVGLQRALRRGHLAQQSLGGRQVAALDASVQDRVVGDSVVRHALCRHLAEVAQRVLQVLLLTVALDERRVENGVFVLSCRLHALKDLHRLVEVATLNARVDHAAVSHCIRILPLLAHLVPHLEHLLKVPCLSIHLHQDAQGHGGGVDVERTHAGHVGLQAVQILEAATSVEKRIEEYLVDVLWLHLNEFLDKGDAAVDTWGVEPSSAVPNGLHEHPGDGVLVCGDALALHVLESAPSLVHPLPSHQVLEGAGGAPHLLIAIPRPATPRGCRHGARRGGAAAAVPALPLLGSAVSIAITAPHLRKAAIWGGMPRTCRLARSSP
mmetsp:Transcript_108940/g.243286  ORF Transcript_108940/g.243286 Transcript_108940/m.243286 type:complete len:335 (+) Transcript_108940:404-1408(+)